MDARQIERCRDWCQPSNRASVCVERDVDSLQSSKGGRRVMRIRPLASRCGLNALLPRPAPHSLLRCTLTHLALEP